MRRKNRTHLALGLMLMAVIAGTCTVVYQSGSKNVPNEKEFVLNEGDSIDEAMKTEEMGLLFSAFLKAAAEYQQTRR